MKYCLVFLYTLVIANIICCKKNPPTPVLINVFVHGTVAPPLAFLNPFAVINDELEGSFFEKICNSIRGSKIFYQDQLVFDVGMHKIEPGNPELNTNTDNFCAAPAILQSLEQINNLCTKDVCKNVYYLFGWNGLLSQRHRRLAALELYKELVKLHNFYKTDNLIPKFRIFGHSHGGNVALNLAGIYYQFCSLEKEAFQFYSNFEISPYVQFLFSELSNLNNEDELATYDGEKLSISEVVLLGTPIQEETSLFMATPFFGKVYNVYSQSDTIQAMDFFSTRGRLSRQRIDFSALDWKIGQFCKTKESLFKNLHQIKITINSPLEKPSRKYKHKRKATLMRILTRTHKSLDPTHKELWYVVSSKLKQEDYIRPIPIICFFPVIKLLINISSENSNSDCALEIFKRNNQCCFELHQNDSPTVLQSLEIEVSTLEEMRKYFSILSTLGISLFIPSNWIDSLTKVSKIINA